MRLGLTRQTWPRPAEARNFNSNPRGVLLAKVATSFGFISFGEDVQPADLLEEVLSRPQVYNLIMHCAISVRKVGTARAHLARWLQMSPASAAVCEVPRTLHSGGPLYACSQRRPSGVYCPSGQDTKTAKTGNLDLNLYTGYVRLPGDATMT